MIRAATSHHRRALLCLLVCTASAQVQAADRPELLEQQVKAAYIYNFSSFVEWPPEAFPAPESALRIGVMEADALADQLELTIAGRTVRGRPLSVHKLRRADPTAGLQLLFVGPISKSQLGDVLSAARQRPTLLVTQAEGALQQGSMVNFVLTDERLRFEIAPKTAEQSGLAISARLLAAALRVEGKSP